MCGPGESAAEEARHRAYRLYGLCFTSHWHLPYAEAADGSLREVRLVEDSPQFFSDAAREAGSPPVPPEWFHHARLRDGSIYLRWTRHFEFVISADGSRIAGRSLLATASDMFHAYLLGQVLSYALLKRGTDPLHGTAVVIDGAVVAFLGDCGSGKSSLAAAFLGAGYRLLTDDLLVVKEDERGFTAYPGPPRIKLFPEMASDLLGEQSRGTPMNDLTPKLVIPLKPHQVHEAATPLKAIYVLTPPVRRAPSERVTIRRLSQRKAFVALLRNTFNSLMTEADRLERQFVQASRIVSTVPVKSLSYSREGVLLPAVREAILADVGR
jgi:hypothetical protein